MWYPTENMPIRSYFTPFTVRYVSFHPLIVQAQKVRDNLRDACANTNNPRARSDKSWKIGERLGMVKVIKPVVTG